MLARLQDLIVPLPGSALASSPGTAPELPGTLGLESPGRPLASPHQKPTCSTHKLAEGQAVAALPAWPRGRAEGGDVGPFPSVVREPGRKEGVWSRVPCALLRDSPGLLAVFEACLRRACLHVSLSSTSFPCPARALWFPAAPCKLRFSPCGQ